MESETKRRASDANGRGFLHLNKRKEDGNTSSPHFHGKARSEDGEELSIAGWLHADVLPSSLREAGVYGISISVRPWKDKEEEQSNG